MSSSQVQSTDRTTFYLVFAFCEHDLAGLLSNPKVRMSLVHIKTMMKHLITGLNKLHRSKILHRDMKAANVLISKEGVLKLADFGLARPFVQRESEFSDFILFVICFDSFAVRPYLQTQTIPDLFTQIVLLLFGIVRQNFFSVIGHMVQKLMCGALDVLWLKCGHGSRLCKEIPSRSNSR